MILLFNQQMEKNKELNLINLIDNLSIFNKAKNYIVILNMGIIFFLIMKQFKISYMLIIKTGVHVAILLNIQKIKKDLIDFTHNFYIKD